MLHEFLTAHRGAIITRSHDKVASRTAPRATAAELEHGIPLFLTQLTDTLRGEHSSADRSTSPEMARSALLHGGHLRRAGFTVGQVVHDYGDVCQAVTELALETGAAISVDEFKTLNRCLGEAIAQAVTEYSRVRDENVPGRPGPERGVVTHELRNLVGNSLIAYEVLRSGSVGIDGSMGALLGRNLRALRDLISRSATEIRLDTGIVHLERVPLGQYMEDAALWAVVEAKTRGHQLTVSCAEPGAMIEGDRQLVSAAITNLLQNAFKFSRPDGHVVLRSDTSTTAARVLIEVEDECGGLPPGGAEELFRPFAQRGQDRSGLGLGLPIARESVEKNGGVLRARSLPDRGCVFTIDVPRLASDAASDIRTV